MLSQQNNQLYFNTTTHLACIQPFGHRGFTSVSMKAFRQSSRDIRFLLSSSQQPIFTCTRLHSNDLPTNPEQLYKRKKNKNQQLVLFVQILVEHLKPSNLSFSSHTNFFRGPITLFPGFSSSSSSDPFLSPSSDCCL